VLVFFFSENWLKTSYPQHAISNLPKNLIS
jgi:hypothetical protein